MELTAAIKAIQYVESDTLVTLYTDAKYVETCIKFCRYWESKGWKGWDGKSIKNTDLLEELVDAMKTRKIAPHWVPGHSGNYYNEICNTIATTLTNEMMINQNPAHKPKHAVFI
jgi:ribonuclease HI